MGTAQEALKSPERGRFPTCKHRHSLSALRVDGAVFQETSGGNSQENNLQLLSPQSFCFCFLSQGHANNTNFCVDSQRPGSQTEGSFFSTLNISAHTVQG